MFPSAYDEDPGKIELVQTHISFVFLTGHYAYKIKKPVDLGFLDFTTLEKRHFFCLKEIELNKRLCPDMYLSVVPINKSTNIMMNGEGETIEYSVKMKRMPQNRIMTSLLEENKVDESLTEKIAKVVADFHNRAETNDRINKFGSMETIGTNWRENFQQTEEYVGKTLLERDFKLIRKEIGKFMKKQKPFFKARMAEGRIRDCHGDIHSGNIFITDKIYIFDAIEFNDRFRFSDVSADVAFLAMDLDFREHHDLSKIFVQKYVEYSEDRDIIKLIPFYKCYRAYVRGKVVSFKLDDPNVGAEEKTEAEKEAKAYFRLASTYAETL